MTEEHDGATAVLSEPTAVPAENPPADVATSGFATKADIQSILDRIESMMRVSDSVKNKNAATEPRTPYVENDAETKRKMKEFREASKAMPLGFVPPEGTAQMDPAMMLAFSRGDIICGKEGTVKIGVADLPEITMWKFTATQTNQEYASNKTEGYKRKVCGSKAASGSVEGKWDRNDLITSWFREGDSVVLKLYLDLTNYITFTAIITSFDVECNIDDNEIEAWTADFEVDGKWTYVIA